MVAGRLGIKLAVWMAVFTGITTAVLGLRMWAIKFIRRGLQLSDYLMIVAYLSTTTMAAANWWTVANGLGKHTTELTSEELDVQYKGMVVDEVTWLVGTVCCKGSILALYRTIFNSYRPMRMLVNVVSGLVVAYFIAFLPVFLTQCHPVSYGWNPVPGGACRSLTYQEISSISLNIFLDTVIAVLPAPALWKLHMPLRNKITISAMFGMGLIVVAVMIMRLIITLSPATSADFVHSLYQIGLFSFLELWLSIIIASLPVLTPLVQALY
ncbi:uncharacterized protein N7483_013192 [Penicillium malachiteum]|uniref:uncharacterized protein n=1 Tax=Penicillium malachiteum TaxID=1324776 RepID=UPI0025482FE7|nr:uncharacterized protein N7483_013192 [Penicillium malachiteum]KAJ5716011.1 hypothetical protein N7483_013192 [Penicillium malachiteum]